MGTVTKTGKNIKTISTESINTEAVAKQERSEATEVEIVVQHHSY